MTTTEKTKHSRTLSFLSQNRWPILEIPVLSVLDFSVIREAVEVEGMVQIKLSPTYSGCPYRHDGLRYQSSLAQKEKAPVDLVLAPAWTTD